MNRQNIVHRLFRQNASTIQIAGYAMASLVGLSIVLAAIQFYRDASTIFANGNDGVLNRDFIVLSKQIGFGDRNVGFSPEEIADIESQPWADATGAFTASRFKASIGVDFAGRGLSTETFFESIPDRFFDKLPEDWNFDASLGSEADVPIIIARDYLALYNFGFASTRGLPTLREGEIGMIPLSIVIRDNNGKYVRMRGHIAGFSSRINTIAVPEAFMEWANDHFASAEERPHPSRLIVQTNTPGNPAIAQYIERHSLDIAGDKIDNGTAAYFLRITTAIVIAIGFIISLLAFFILMLSIFLLLQKNSEKLRQLMLLGYSPAQVAAPYIQLILAVNTIVLLLASAITMIIANTWNKALDAIGSASTSIMPTIACGLAIMVIVSILNITTVRRRIRENF